MADIAGLVGLEGSQADCEFRDELKNIGNLMDHRFQAVGNLLGTLPQRLCLPENYLVVDLETSGFDPNEDLIVEVGWAIVQNRRVVDWAGMLLNWTAFDPHNREFQDWLYWRLERVAASFAAKGRTYHITHERMRSEGVPPIQGLYDFAQLLWTFMNARACIVGHGAWQFDRKRIDIAMDSFLDGYKLPWHLSPMIDTGLIEKASQIDKPPCETETLDEWYKRISGTWSRAKWNLDDHCVAKYNLAERFHLDTSLAHTAGADCLTTWALAETYRQIGESCRGIEAD